MMSACTNLKLVLWKTQTVKDINRLAGEKTIHTIDSVGVFDYCAA